MWQVTKSAKKAHKVTKSIIVWCYYLHTSRYSVSPEGGIFWSYIRKIIRNYKWFFLFYFYTRNFFPLNFSDSFDPLHIHNHKRKKCSELYNPDKVKEAVPEANLMCAEQTFAWFGRFKKICNSMSKIHFHFVLHRLIKQRNAYTSHCYKNGKKPLLPSAKIAKTDCLSNKYFAD